MSDGTWLVAGLGNPGAGYAGNRHNIGQMVLDELAQRVGSKFKTHASRSQIVEGRMGVGGPRIVLAKPTVFTFRAGQWPTRRKSSALVSIA